MPAAAIRDLLRLVDTGAAAVHDGLVVERDRLRAEVDRLVASIAAGVPPQTVAPQIREREAAIARLEVRLRTPRPETPDLDRLRAALEQKSAEWRSDLRARPEVARMVVRRLIGPLTLWEDDRPDFVQYEGPTTPEKLLEGLVDQHGTSPTGFEPVFWP